jgi:hypothetical protein
MAQQMIEDTLKDVGAFLVAFGVAYTTELLNAKIEGAIEDVIKGVMPENEDGNEEKKLEDKMNDIKPIAAGVMLMSYKNAWGPDRVEHRYYDMACWSVKPKDSVITNVTFRHRQLLGLYTTIKKKVPEAGEMAFPQKKRFGKRDGQFYSDRFVAMQKYFDTMSKNPKIALDEDWLKFFKLQFDPAAALRLQIFQLALASICAKDSIDWEYSFGYAQRLGLDVSQVDLLKIVAVEKVGRNAAWRVYDKVWEVSPGFIPGSVKSKMANSAQGKLYVAISTTVETSWNGIEQGFNKVADTLNDVMDKAVDPLKEMFNKVLQPCKEFIESKLASKKEEGGSNEESESESKGGGGDIDEALKNVKADRYPPLKDAFELLKTNNNEKNVADTCRKTMSRICDLDYTWKYTPYIQYPSGDPILQWFPPIENIIEKHNRLTVAMIDVVYVLGRGLCRAFEPLCEYVDKCIENWDEKQHEEEIRNSVWIGGKRLAMDYFSLPYTTWRACWWCGNSVTEQVLTFCKETINLEADLLGKVAQNWKPSNKTDSKEKFINILIDSLNEFISNRTFVLFNLIRDASIQLVADLFNEMFGENINKIAELLNDLVSKLPPPLSDLKPGDIVSSLFQMLVSKASNAAVKRWASKTERFITDPSLGEPQPWNEEIAAKFRFKPKIRNDNDDNTKPEVSEEDAKRNQKPNAETKTETETETVTATEKTD